jgi:HlyD family secretion protein
MPLPGRIKPIEVEEGDVVKEGDEVARLDPADLDTDLAEAVAQVNQYEKLTVSMRRAVEQAEATVVAREAKVKYASDEYKRKSSLAEKKVTTQSELDAAELLHIESKVDFQKDSLQVRILEAIESYVQIGREDNVEKQKRRQRDRNRASLRSPVTGVVLKRNESNERYFPAGEILLELGHLEDLEVEAEILTQDASQIAVGDAVDIEAAGLGDAPLRGKVWRINPRGFTKISSLGVEQQRVLVIIRFEKGVLAGLERAGMRLGIDYRVRVRIYTDQSSGVPKVSRSALFRGPEGNWQCFAIRDGRLELVNLELGLMNDFEAEVRKGLNPGDEVVIAPESSLTPGKRVAQRTAK